MSDATICHSFESQTLFGPLPSERSGCLVRLYPADSGFGMWNLDGTEVFLGRDYDCDVHLESDAASRRHAAIHRDEEGDLLVDLNSTNGTYVNDQLVKRHRLSAGDRIRIGEHILKYLSSDRIERQYHETVFRMTTRDGLTEAYNRQFLGEFLERELLRCAERNRDVSVALLDIDFFKQVNDSHGHLAGDQVLREFCSRASGALRASDLFARFGGEEFCAVFCESDEEEAVRMAEAIRQVIADTPFATQSGDLPITVSIGVVSWDGAGEQPAVDSILNAADEKLYAAKESGRNQVCSARLR